MKLLLTLALLSSAFAQTVTITANPTTVAPGGTVALTISLTPAGSAGPSLVSFQHILSAGAFPGLKFGSPTAVAGAPVIPKIVQCEPTNRGCGIFGIDTGVTPNLPNHSPLPSGTQWVQSVTIPATASGPLSISVTSLAGVDANGSPVTVNPGAAASIAIQSTQPKLDLNGDGRVDLTDIGLAVSQVVGSFFTLASCTTADVNGDGKCDVVDVQLIIKAAGF